VVNRFWQQACELIADRGPTNGVLMRGIASRPDIPSVSHRWKLTPAAIATYPMYLGLAKLVGMELVATGKTTEDEIQTVLDNYDKYDYFFVHVKGTDEAGEDGDFERKVSVIEHFDGVLPKLLERKPDVVAITGDHSTPCMMHYHSWHPVPLLIHSANCGADLLPRFTESNCNTGSLGIFESLHLMPLLLANAGKLYKFGA
jgi:2,3-bisphosphoglycerate-independent phosphoglycerate mutase